jgi:formylmethanofuran dehydrogenase subunit B
VKRESPDALGVDSQRCTCTGCPLLCDDILITAADGVEQACDHGSKTIHEALADELPSAAPPAEASADDTPIDRETAIERAAEMLASARRVLVTGLANAPLEAITAACDLAESLGAAVDTGLPESARAAGPTIARAGEVTAAFEELRDRADLVIFWCCNPTTSHPRFIERFVTPPLADGRPRQTIAIGPDGVMPDASSHRHLPLSRDLAVEAARLLHLRIAGRHAPDRLAGPLASDSATLHDAIRSATCVAIVTSDAADPVGLEAWSIVHLVRTIAHERQAFQIPLGAGIAAGGANAAGAAAACTWRYGAAGGIARADRMGSLFLPGESDARRLIDRGEVDAVVILGRLGGPLEQAIADRGDAVLLVRISDAAEMTRQPPGHTIHLRCASLTTATTGTMLREDGRRVVLAPSRQSTLPHMRERLVDLTGAVRQSHAVAAVGGRP